MYLLEGGQVDLRLDFAVAGLGGHRFLFVSSGGPRWAGINEGTRRAPRGTTLLGPPLPEHVEGPALARRGRF